MARLDTRKCFGRYDGAAEAYRNNGDDDDEDDEYEDGYDDDVCRFRAGKSASSWHRR